MTKTKSTKRALLLSALSLLMCVSMLIGSTFAWFTDEVTSAGNKIQAGTLDIDLYKVEIKDDWADHIFDSDFNPFEEVEITDSSEPIFSDDILWEPGYTEVANLKLVNNGNLALHWQAVMVPKGEVGELAKVIDVYTLTGEVINTANDRESYDDKLEYIGTLADVMGKTAIFKGNMENESDVEFFSLVLKMKESAGNEYQGKSAGEFDIRIVATQHTYESDSFDDQYDRNAVWLNPNDGSTPVEGEVYDTEQFKYTYKAEWGGWHASTANKDKTRTSYTLFESINGVPVTNLTTTFSGCTNLVEAPVIPAGVTTMYQTFKGCTSLVEAPVIPEGVTNMYYTFEGCSSLVEAPEIPVSVTNMQRTFTGCTSLTTAPSAIPANVTTLSYAFNGCKALVATPDLSGATSLENMEGAFNGCSALVTASAIPNSVTNMSKAFQNCTSLVNMPEISEGVQNMSYAFSGCTALATATVIPSSVTNMTSTFSNCPSLTGTVTINANPASYTNCFGLTSEGKDITLTGSSSLLSGIAGYQNYRTITIQ